MSDEKVTIETLREIVDMAVEAWHDVADEHGIKHCNCFLDMFVTRLIKAGHNPHYEEIPSTIRVCCNCHYCGRELELKDAVRIWIGPVRDDGLRLAAFACRSCEDTNKDE